MQPIATKISMRDGVRIDADIYAPASSTSAPPPAIVHLTPYVGKIGGHRAGTFFAANGYVFVRVSCRGCGDSEGFYELFVRDGRDGFDAVEWVADQPWCSGRVAMWGGSYCGFTQWATAAQSPPHLAAIAPAASAGIVRDYPMVNNIVMSHSAFYCNFVDRDATDPESTDGEPFSWREVYYKRFIEHHPFSSLDSLAGRPSALFQGLIDHPTLDSYWKSVLPDDVDYETINIPILTITGHYDGDQRGALMYYRKHHELGSQEAIQQHQLVFGPWNHAGVGFPERHLAGLDFGDSSVIDIRALQLQWYDWVLRGKARPEFMERRVVYFVEGCNRWESCDDLRELESHRIRYNFASPHKEASLSRPGKLTSDGSVAAATIGFVYDPLDTSPGEFERSNETVYHHDGSHEQRFLADQASVLAQTLKCNGVVYDSDPFANDVVIAGNLRALVWISMDVPDTDFQISLYEVMSDETCIMLSDAMLRARYRNSLATESLVQPGEITRYEFDQFQFFVRQIRKGSRLRLVLQCVNSIYWQKNYNSGGVVAQETAKDARTAHVIVHQDVAHPSYLEIPTTV